MVCTMSDIETARTEVSASSRWDADAIVAGEFRAAARSYLSEKVYDMAFGVSLFERSTE